MTDSSCEPEGESTHVVAVLELDALVDQQGDVAAVVDDELRPLAAGEAERLVRTPPVLFEGLALPGEDRDAGGGDGGGGVVLGGEDVAAGPAHVGAERDHGLDQHRGLDGHVQRAGDADAGQRLARGILVADGHEAGHLLLGDVDLFAAKVRQANVRDLVLRRQLPKLPYRSLPSPSNHLIFCHKLSGR